MSIDELIKIFITIYIIYIDRIILFDEYVYLLELKIRNHGLKLLIL